MAAATAESTIDDLPDHVLSEVMLRVPTPAALVHAAAVSKRWRGVIVTSTGKFLQDYRARHKSSPFLGLYILRESGGLPSFQMADSIQYAKADDDDSDLDLQHAVAKLTFSLGSLGRHPQWRLLDCHNGRLLLARGCESLEVYNPLSRDRISVGLPRDVILADGFSACLLQGHGDDGSSFRVVSVQRHCRDRMVHAAEYDSLRKSWNHHRDWKIMSSIEGTQREVMHAGNLFFCKYTGASLLLLDTREMQFSVLPLPTDNNWKRYAIGEMEDGVCCLASVDLVGVSNTPYLRVWKLDKLDWKLDKAMEIAQVLGKHVPDGILYYKARKVTNGVAVLCSSRCDVHFVIDLKTFRVMEKFEFNRDLLAFPMQMHWPPAFSVATISGEQSTPAALGGEAEGAETRGECEEEAAETGGRTEDTAEDEYDAETVSDPSEITRVRRSETRESFVRLDHGAQCPFSVNNELHRDYRIKDSERQKRKGTNPTVSGAETDSPSPPPDHLRCRRNDGKKWRCLGHALPTVSFCEYHYTKANKGRKLPAVEGEVLAVALQRQKNKIMNPPMAAISEEGAAQTGGENEVAVEDFDTNGDAAEESPPTRGHCRKRPNPYDEAEETPVPSRHHRRQKSGDRGDSPLPPPDHLRCRRNDGKKWRCLGHALPTVSFCEYHYTKANKGKKLPVVDGEVLAVALQRRKNNIMNQPMAAISEEGAARTGGENEVAVEDFDTNSDAAEESPPTRPNPYDEAEETPVPSRHHRRQKSGERADSPLPPPDHLRCRRNDGKKWRCLGHALPTVGFCEYHYTKTNKGKKLPADGEVLAVALQRQKNKNINSLMAKISEMNPSSGEGVETRQQSGERGDSLPNHLRCRRSDGKKWRCSGLALPTVSFCSYHYVKANKGKKLPADGEVLAVALQRLKNKEKGRKNCKKDFCNSSINKWSACASSHPEPLTIQYLPCSTLAPPVKLRENRKTEGKAKMQSKTKKAKATVKAKKKQDLVPPQSLAMCTRSNTLESPAKGKDKF